MLWEVAIIMIYMQDHSWRTQYLAYRSGELSSFEVFHLVSAPNEFVFAAKILSYKIWQNSKKPAISTALVLKYRNKLNTDNLKKNKKKLGVSLLDEAYRARRNYHFHKKHASLSFHQVK